MVPVERGDGLQNFRPHPSVAPTTVTRLPHACLWTVRSIKHGLLIQPSIDLAVGELFNLCNRHDPVPLRYQFEATFPDTSSWDYAHRQPEDLAVKITKHKALEPIAGELPSACRRH